MAVGDALDVGEDFTASTEVIVAVTIPEAPLDPDSPLYPEAPENAPE